MIETIWILWSKSIGKNGIRQNIRRSNAVSFPVAKSNNWENFQQNAITDEEWSVIKITFRTVKQSISKKVRFKDICIRTNLTKY